MKSLKQQLTLLFLSVFIGLQCISLTISAQSEDQKAVLITGASSGIGLLTTKLLAFNGYFVYAGARKQADMDMLNTMENVQAVRLDVTKHEDIGAAVEMVKNGGKGLFALINNAGIVYEAPLIEMDEDKVKWLFDVNVYGPMRITKAFAPMIIESKGRISTTGSVAGVSTGIFYGPYSMTKHAIEAFTDALAIEMERFGVSVSVIEPAAYETKISNKRKDRIEEFQKSAQSSLYKDELIEQLKARLDRKAYAPDAVAEAFLEAISSEEPKKRYMVVPTKESGEYFVTSALSKALELNENQEYKLSKDELVSKFNGLLMKMED